MKKLLILFTVIVAGMATLTAQVGANTPGIKFSELVYDFGTFPEETGKVAYTFEFTNTGKSVLILQNVKASCGCTTPTWTKEPVAPGGMGVVEVIFDATGRAGAFNKTITVTTNAGEETLTIKGEVIPKIRNKES